MESFDLDALDTRKGAEDGFELQLRHPTTDEPLPGKIRLHGQDSSFWQEKQAELVQRRVNRLQKSRKAAPATVEELESDAIELLAAVTAGWSGISMKNAEFPYSAENVLQLYRGFPWIREQVEEAVKNRANFLPGSATG